MSYESTAEPVKVGYLMDFKLPPGFPEELFASFTQTFDLIFEEAVAQGLMDRPVQMVYREVEGLPKGSVKAVIDAYGELVDEGCLVVFGPNITDNCVPLREAISDRGAIQGSGYQRDRHRRLVGGVDLRIPPGVDDR
jgi:branched-chain amino acid transport system substrate-binding protein